MKTKSGNPAMTPFEVMVPEFNMLAFKENPKVYAREFSYFQTGKAKLFKNGLYTVTVFYLDVNGEDGVIQIAIRRNDRKASRDWRHFQKIKNEIVGAEREAIEIYPPESQLMDTANSYHLWVLPKGQQIPFGYREGRMVSGNDVAQEIGAVQREPEDEGTVKISELLGAGNEYPKIAESEGEDETVEQEQEA